ncbi:MAG TPA: hypothetical protein VF170_02605, partial [Planctomycetaceae bacterium]
MLFRSPSPPKPPRSQAPPPGEIARAARLPPSLTRRVTAFDKRVDAAVDRIRNPALDRVMYAATELGDFALIWHLVSATRGLRS